MMLGLPTYLGSVQRLIHSRPLLTAVFVSICLELAFTLSHRQYHCIALLFTHQHVLQHIANTRLPFLTSLSLIYLCARVARKVYSLTLGVVNTRATANGRLTRVRDVSSEVFSVTINTGPWEKSGTVTERYILKSDEKVEKMLNDRNKSYTVTRPGNLIQSMDVAYIPLQGSGEDTWSFDIISRRDLEQLNAAEPEGETFWLKWHRLANLSRRAGVTRVTKENDLAVPDSQSHLPSFNDLDHDGSEDITVCCMLDGHGGPEISKLLSRTLGAVLVNALASLGEAAQDEEQRKERLHQTVREFCEDLLRIPSLFASGSMDDLGPENSIPRPSPALMQLGMYENAGACVSALIVDQKYGRMYCINLGDCRVVAGWYNPKTQSWRCERLSEIGDMRCDNAYERARPRDEHFEQDPTDVIIDRGSTNRLLGNSQLSRTMGDNKYKRDPEEMRRLEQAFGFKYDWPFKFPVNPPYMSHDAEIIVRSLNPDSEEQLKFLILATDGLWDVLSDEEATILTAARTEGYSRSTVSKKSLPDLYKLSTSDTPRPWPIDDLPGTTKTNSAGTWSFQKDDTLAQNLLRNGIGYGDPWLMKRFLSMEAGFTRRVRDDVTVMVLRFGDAQ